MLTVVYILQESFAHPHIINPKGQGGMILIVMEYIKYNLDT